MKQYIIFIVLIIALGLIIYLLPKKEVSKIDLHPALYINTKNEIGDDYIKAKLKSYNNSYDVLIKLRGNTSRGYAKRPYAIKSLEDINLLGLGYHQKYNLISNGYDETLMRNKIVYDFANNTNLDYSVRSKYVNIYLNNEYIGNYLLTTKVDDFNNDYLLEYEASRNEIGERYFITNKYNWRFNIHNGEDMNELSDFFDKLELAIEKQNYAIIRKYMDLDSIVDSYIMLEYFKDVDCGFSSSYFFIKDNKLYAGPAWDFDLSMGFKMLVYPYDEYFNRNAGNYSNNSYESLYCNRNIYGELLKTKPFKQKVITRYQELQPLIKSIYMSKNLKPSVIDQYDHFYRRDFEKNNIVWKQYWVLDLSYEDRLEYLKRWLKLRNEWLLKEYLIDYH